jgi:hypothetical protein
MRESDIEGLAIHGGPEPCVVVRKGGGEASVGVRAAGLLSLVISLSGVPTSSYKAEGNIVGGVFASRRRTPRGRRTCACAESPDARTGRSHDHPLVLMVGRVVRGRPRP